MNRVTITGMNCITRACAGSIVVGIIFVDTNIERAIRIGITEVYSLDALFLVVQSESAMSDRGADTSSAFHLANAGLARYMGESVGQPGDSMTYQMGRGLVRVTAQRVMSVSATEDIYLISSEAEIADRRRATSVSRSSVRQCATLRRFW